MKPCPRTIVELPRLTLAAASITSESEVTRTTPNMKSRSRFHLALANLVLTAGSSPAGAADWTPLLDPNLSQWEIWMGAPHSSVTGLPGGTPKFDDVTKGTPLGLGQNSKEVFTVIEEDGQLVLRITGEIYAGLTSLAEYGDFHFTAQVRWGSAK